MSRRAFYVVLLAGLFHGLLASSNLKGAESLPLYAVAISPDGKLIATGGRDGSIIVRELGAGGESTKLNVGKTVFALAFAPDGQTLAAGCENSHVHLWTVRGHGLIFRRALACRGNVLAVAFSPSGKWLAAGVEGSGNIHLFDVASAKLQCTIWEAANLISSLAFTPDGKALASAGVDFKLWDVRPKVLEAIASDRLDLDVAELRANGKRSQKWEAIGESEYAAGIAVSPDGKWLAGVTGIGGPNSGGKTLTTWDAASGRRLKTIASKGMTTVVITPKGDRMITGSDDGMLRVWNPETAALTKQWAAHSSAVRAIAIIPGSSLLATVGADGNLKIWDWSTGELKSARGAKP